MRIKTFMFLCCLVQSKMIYAEGPCRINLVPKDATSKYIEALKCLDDTLDNLQVQIDGLKTSVAQTASDAQSAQSAAADAADKAAAAESAANRAAQYAQDTNSKLDTMFKKSMKP